MAFKIILKEEKNADTLTAIREETNYTMFGGLWILK
jgi:hypothetical protein